MKEKNNPHFTGIPLLSFYQSVNKNINKNNFKELYSTALFIFQFSKIFSSKKYNLLRYNSRKLPGYLWQEIISPQNNNA
jgi:hypothetical protein